MQKGKKKLQDRSSARQKKRTGRAGERKDRVLQARVPKTLYRDLVSRARGLRVPLSNLVRNILEDSTRMVENILESSFEIAHTLSRGVDEKDLKAVLGWQPMIANRDLACSHCGGSIHKGKEAFMGVGSPDGRSLVICEGCKSRI